MLTKKEQPIGLSSDIPTATPHPHTESEPRSAQVSTVFSPLFDDGFGITRLVLEPSRGFDFGIDYLRVKGYFREFDNVLGATAVISDSEVARFSDKSWSAGPGATLYEKRLEHPLISGGCRWDEDLERFEVCLDLSGQFWGSLTGKEQFAKLRLCRFFGFYSCSRIDLKFDDYSFEVIPYSEMAKAGKTGNVFGTHTYKPFREYVSGELVSYGDYYGSRNSTNFLRCYVHTFGEQEYHSMRLELEIKRKAAQSVYHLLSEFDYTKDVSSWDDIIQDEFGFIFGGNGDFENTFITDEGIDKWGRCIAAIICGVFDFRDKSKADSRRDSERFDWWQKFLDFVGSGLRVKVNADAPSLPKTLRWIHRQWVTTLAQFKYALGISGFNNLMQTLADYGAQNLRECHLSNIEYLMKNPDAVCDFRDSEFVF